MYVRFIRPSDHSSMNHNSKSVKSYQLSTILLTLITTFASQKMIFDDHGLAFTCPRLSGKYMVSTQRFIVIHCLLCTIMIGNAVFESFSKIKDKILNMDIASKRLLYHCGDQFVTLNQVRTWPQYAKDEQLKSSLSEEEDEKLFSVNDEINSKVSLWQGDITRLEVDGIVNAANESLQGGGGVDGAIHQAAGEHLLNECETLKGCETGSAKITGGYNLPAKYVIHAVGPREKDWRKLKSAYETSLNLMLEHKLRSIAFPCISTGIFGYPIEHATHVALKTVRDFLHKNTAQVDRIIFVTYQPTDTRIYQDYMFRYFPLQGEKGPDAHL